ncbi:MAG: YdeI/OmpD-associated family protein [Luteimonas sp.]
MIVDPSLIVSFKDQKGWEEWLSKNYARQEGAWLKLFKKGSNVVSINYAEALDVALCYGWIDGQLKKLDDISRVQRFTPRRKKSVWSQRNTEHIERLTKEGRMKPSGIAEVERAKADGRWEKAYASPANTIAPNDFIKAIDANKKAKEFWETLNKTNRYAMIWQMNDAKKPETRERKINKFVKMLEQKEKLY